MVVPQIDKWPWHTRTVRAWIRLRGLSQSKRTIPEDRLVKVAIFGQGAIYMMTESALKSHLLQDAERQYGRQSLKWEKAASLLEKRLGMQKLPELIPICLPSYLLSTINPSLKWHEDLRGSWAAARRWSSSSWGLRLSSCSKGSISKLKPPATNMVTLLSWTRSASTQQMLTGTAAPGGRAWKAMRWNICLYWKRSNMNVEFTGKVVWVNVIRTPSQYLSWICELTNTSQCS